jgi:hypothetical protein
MNYLKKITSRLFLLTLVVVSGCSKEDLKPSLIGTWKEGRTIVGGCFEPTSNGKSACSGICNVVISASSFKDTDQSDYQYTLNGNTITLKTNNGSLAFTYELTAGSLILALANQSTGCVLTIYYTKV